MKSTRTALAASLALIIIGGPRTGKTTLANKMGSPGEGTVLHTDDKIPLGWSEASEWIAANWLMQPGPWIMAAIGLGVTASASPSPNLCDIDEGRLCSPCGYAGGPQCPTQTSSGWLCCIGGVCVATAVNDCEGGVLGWCDNYTEDEASGAATCHDVPG